MNVLFVGLDNPQSGDPRYALFPHPPNCTGDRLHKMMMEIDPTFSQRSYINIPKTNLFSIGRMPKKDKKMYLTASAILLVAQLKNTGKKIILMGEDVTDAVWSVSAQNFDFDKPMKFADIDGAHYAWIPHPSGRNQYYNDTRRRRKIGRFLIGVAK